MLEPIFDALQSCEAPATQIHWALTSERSRQQCPHLTQNFYLSIMASFPFLRDDDLLVVEEIINFRFANRSLLREALQAAALADRDGNKRLAVLGDAAHRLILVVEGHTRNETRGMRDYQDD